MACDEIEKVQTKGDFVHCIGGKVHCLQLTNIFLKFVKSLDEFMSHVSCKATEGVNLKGQIHDNFHRVGFDAFISRYIDEGVEKSWLLQWLQHQEGFTKILFVSTIVVYQPSLNERTAKVYHFVICASNDLPIEEETLPHLDAVLSVEVVVPLVPGFKALVLHNAKQQSLNASD